jgi:hypothetical protein
MPQISQLFFKTAIIWLIIGLIVGLQMGMSGNHTTIAAHAHVNLLGWVSSAIFGGYYAMYTFGLVVMLPALYFMELGNTQLEPLVGIGSLITFAGALVFAAVIFSKEVVGVREARQA